MVTFFFPQKLLLSSSWACSVFMLLVCLVPTLVMFLYSLIAECPSCWALIMNLLWKTQLHPSNRILQHPSWAAQSVACYPRRWFRFPSPLFNSRNFLSTLCFEFYFHLSPGRSTSPSHPFPPPIGERRKRCSSLPTQHSSSWQITTLLSASNHTANPASPHLSPPPLQNQRKFSYKQVVTAALSHNKGDQIGETLFF